MTKRIPTTTPQNIWFDTQKVDNDDLSLEQDHNTAVEAAIVNNHIGTGIVPETLEQNVIFTSEGYIGLLDGLAIDASNQPADNNLGNQLEVSLKDSKVAGRRTVKAAVIGLDFEGNLQYETFAFKVNEVQVGKLHFTKVLVLLFNDLVGDPNLSLNLGGVVTINEVKPITLSRDTLMVAQNVEPNLFFRDFFVDGPLTLQTLLETALPTYNVDTLGIYTNEKDNKVLANGDVTTQYGQKFLATTNNIQKIALLLSVRNSDTQNANDLVWNGDLIINIYPLQISVTNPSDIAPELQIDFPPDAVPLTQLSVNYSTLKESGSVLDSVPQPVDFVFSNSPVAGGNVLEVGRYYAFTIKRSGAANKCDILIATGNDHVSNSRVTAFTSSLWVDLPEEDLWFELSTDAAKVADGQAYDTGIGIVVDKTLVNPITQVTEDYSKGGLQFVGNDVYNAMLSALTVPGTPIPSEITGTPVFSRKETEPKVDLLNTIDLANIDESSEPLLLGSISDQNRKYYDSISSQITSNLHTSTLVKDHILIKIIDDQTDTGRYDTSVTELVSNLLNGEFTGAKIIPNSNNPLVYYRIASAKLCNMIVGDVDGNGIIDASDVDLLQTYYGENLNVSPPNTTVVAIDDGYGNPSAVPVDGYTLTYTNGYQTVTQPFSNLFGLSFALLDPITNLIVASGNDGVLVADPNNDRGAQFTSATVNFNIVVSLSSYKLVLLDNTVDSNYGGFDIISLQSITDVLYIRKVILTPQSFEEMLRADIDGDLRVTAADGYLLSEYVANNPDTLSSTTTYPAPATNAYTKIGTHFNVVKFQVELYDDRTDDYTNLNSGRSTGLHTTPDIFEADGYFQDHDYYTNPAVMLFEKKLTWDKSLVVTNSNPQRLPSVYSNISEYSVNSCDVEGVVCTVYPQQPEFNKGTVDFYVPDNLILGKGGTFKNEDGTDYKVDFEVGSIVLEVPDGLFGTERTLNILEDFIADYNGNGITKLGYPAMRFADCSFVPQDGLVNDQVRFSVAVQSFSPNVDGYSTDGYGGTIVDGKMGVSVDYATGLVTLNFTNLYEDGTLPTLSTKIQITVYMKKAGFNNKPKFIDSDKVSNILSLISVFSGANVGGVSALVDLEDDTTGILPVVHGGLGMNSVGSFGTVLTSNGSALDYQFVYDLTGVISKSDGYIDANRIPKTDGYGLLDPSFYYKQPLSLYALAGVASSDTAAPTVIGAIKFRFDEYILQALGTVKLEVILENNLPSGASANDAKISLFDVTSQSYVILDGVATFISTASEVPVVLQSDDLKSVLLEGATDFVYEVHLHLTNEPAIYVDPTDTDLAICKSAKLVLDYDNPYRAEPPLGESINFHPTPGY